MCDDCRVVTEFEQPRPMASRPRPLTRTTEDHLRERDIEREQKKAREMYERSQDDAEGVPPGAEKPPGKTNGGET